MLHRQQYYNKNSDNRGHPTMPRQQQHEKRNHYDNHGWIRYDHHHRDDNFDNCNAYHHSKKRKEWAPVSYDVFFL
jgi:hypothetical protein